MKIVCNKQVLLDGINIGLKAIASKTTMPIISCFVIDVKDNIKLISNNMEMGIETVVDGQIIEPGTIAIDARFFAEIIKKMPDDIITIETDYDFKATISCGKSKFNIIGKSAEEFPFLPKIEKNDAITISQFSLKEIITQTVFSVSPDENNKIMTGELIEINDDNLKIASLDGHRISLRKIKLLKSYEPVKVIVPGKALTELSRILSDDIEKNVSVYLTNKHILFEFDNTILLSRLIEGKYYNIDVMISNDYETKITINKNELLGCIDRASLLIRESEKKPIVFNIGAENLEIKMITNSGTMNEDLSIVREGADMVIGFNPKFIMDVLRVIDDEYIDFYMMDFKSPACIKDKDGNYIYLVLPINIAN